MHTKQTDCTCTAVGVVHTADCGCHRAAEFLEKPTAAYLESRRAFLRKLMVSGLTVAALPFLIEEEANADLFRPSASDQKKLGEQAAQEVVKKYRVVNDSRARKFNRIGTRLVNALPSDVREKWDYRFRVVESKDVNAFALPGGNMFMYTGLLDRIGSDDELAAVTAHEIAHVRGEHWARQVEKQQKQKLGLAVILGLTKANRSWQQVAGGLDYFVSLKYSRDDEYNADSNGLKNMVAARFDPRGMIDLFETLQKASGGRSGGPEFLSTHPLTRERIERVEEFIAKQD
jgi:beta-barrel assembly-enhancing protease